MRRYLHHVPNMATFLSFLLYDINGCKKSCRATTCIISNFLIHISIVVFFA
jgi:hypothetical protein